jgi:hypothetical protein
MNNFPKHVGAMHLAHNEHCADNYRLDEYIAVNNLAGHFESTDTMQKAIDTGELWIIEWSPSAESKLLTAAAATLDELLCFASTMN